ncbi:tRNA methyltransferase complex GCD14 subunit-domain-containing protein [Collybia nuda]|uniref:tRNA (adenine(58)-N(1))-methyltransferase catalytic subunit TRM61 n=1 Tax=Collybia nuda TaxID=64659 RepID=A0A9P5YAQ5_9AGAR|nr:tRNA methyltransferase complex GCD14 subunit-domain-containing protein [Collybia nuda]
MWSTSREIAAGDVVIIWLTRDVIQPLLVTPGKDFNSKFGHYRHADLVGIPYGSKVGSRNGKGFVHVLRPTPELWTMALPHRTQILYLADIAFITSYLDIKRGSRVIEAGTGSGSFSHSVARTVGPAGHLYSYEFHEVRASKAKEEFAQHGMDNIVTLTHRNVCKDGFTVIDTVDAVFLDLPAPWEAIEHAKQALRKDRTTRICCFSPCMEQVLRTVSSLNDSGFTEITMYETLLRPLDVTHVPAPTPISEISEKLKQAERRREEKRLKQIAAGRSNATKRKREAGVEPLPAGAEEADDSLGSKRVKTDDENLYSLAPNPESEIMDLDAELPDTATPTFTGPATSQTPISAAKISLSKVLSEVRGHTSYLTFASLQPFTPTDSATTGTPDSETILSEEI